MQPLDLNLSSQPFRNNTLLWTGYGLGAALVLWFTVWNVNTYLGHRSQLAEMRDTLSGMDTQVRLLDQRKLKAERAMRRDEFELTRLTVQADKANEVIGWKAFSWTRLFNRLERAQPWNVKVASVRPIFHVERASGGRNEDEDPQRAVPIAVEGYAKDLTALLSFERALFADPNFDSPEPERHAPDDRGEILFTMRFLYYPEAPGDAGAGEAEGGGDEADPGPAVEDEDGGPPAQPGAEAEVADAAPAEVAGDDTEAADAVEDAERLGVARAGAEEGDEVGVDAGADATAQATEAAIEAAAEGGAQALGQDAPAAGPPEPQAGPTPPDGQVVAPEGRGARKSPPARRGARGRR